MLQVRKCAILKISPRYFRPAILISMLRPLLSKKQLGHDLGPCSERFSFLNPQGFMAPVRHGAVRRGRFRCSDYHPKTFFTTQIHFPVHVRVYIGTKYRRVRPPGFCIVYIFPNLPKYNPHSIRIHSMTGLGAPARSANQLLVHVSTCPGTYRTSIRYKNRKHFPLLSEQGVF